jgi:NhaP-type Na+/H+ or K+/H+ antiporter
MFDRLKFMTFLIIAALAGLILAVVFGWQGLEHSSWYVLVASALLCFGLYMAVYGIDRQEAKRHWRIVLIAVTFGVVCKYLIIFGITYLVTQNWQYAVLGMALAQIDPLSVAALSSDKRMTKRTRTILNMWAACDDPMTAIATPLLLGAAATLAHQKMAEGSSWVDVLVSIAPFAGTLLVVGLLALYRRMKSKNVHAILQEKLDNHEPGKNVISGLTAIIAIPMRLYSMAALAGWFVRPSWLGVGRRAEFALNIALYSATFLLGILLAGGVDITGGITLGVATYGSQVIAAWLVMWAALLVSKKENHSKSKLSRRDTWHLALSQQNGITAIVLALNLEPVINGSVAVVSLAIVTVNVLNAVCNGLFDRYSKLA